MKKNYILLILAILLSTTILPACGGLKPVAKNKIQIVATTSILADVVQQVAGDHAEVSSLVPVGANEHEYQPAPRDIAAVSDADLVFEVGLRLEEFMSTIVQNANTRARIVTVSDGITPRQFQGLSETTHPDSHGEGDPHVWLDPTNVIVWVKNIESALVDFDPRNAAEYQANSQAYIDSLNQLDAWITEQVSTIPEEKRKIVTDHMLLGYFAERYGLEMVGAVVPAYSSSAQPSAQEMAALEDAIRSYGVKVILVGNTVNPALAGRIAQDTGTQLVTIYTGSLSAADGPAAMYLEYMRYNVNTIVTALSR